MSELGDGKSGRRRLISPLLLWSEEVVEMRAFVSIVDDDDDDSTTTRCAQQQKLN